MYNSRNIDDLRPDVAVNCRVWLELCRAAGLNVLVHATVRDKEYQEHCYRTGASKTPTPSFHAQGIGLAFDFCKNVKGQEFSDARFFQQAGELGELVGFEWGGRWKSFPDKPHLQWSQGGKYTSSMILMGKRPPEMPLYEKEEKDMSREEMESMVKESVTRELAERDSALAQVAQKVSSWAAESWERATEKGIFDGTRPGAPLTREQAAVVLDRLGLLSEEGT